MTSPHRAGLSAALLVAIAAVTVSCAAESPDAEENSAWMTAWLAEHAEVSDAVTTMSGLVDESTGTEVTATMDQPERVESFEFFCSGDGTMQFSVSSRQGDSTTAVTTAVLDCSESPHRLSTVDVGLPPHPISELTLAGINSSASTAWGAIAHR